MIKLVLIVFMGAVAVQGLIKSDVSTYFPGLNGNLTKVTWAHAVNNQSLLNEALRGIVMMIEADVGIGTVNDSVPMPIMCHPPANTSDLSLKEFLFRVTNYNSKTGKIGVKLDFKSLEAFTESIEMLNETFYPIWLNADILSGPVNPTTTPVNATEFLRAASSFKNSTLSIGWTTTTNAGNKNASYTKEQINEMINTIENSKVDQPITFPVRAGLAAESISVLSELLEKVSGSTLTLWSGDGDSVDVKNLKKLIETVGISRTYVDVPSDILSQLHLETISASTVTKSHVVVLIATVLFAVIF